MSVTLWINEAADEAIELGQTFAVYSAFAEMVRVAGDFARWQADYPDLSSVLTQCELQEDADPAWLSDVRKQASAFLREHGNEVGRDARNLLENLASAPDDDVGSRAEEMEQPQIEKKPHKSTSADTRKPAPTQKARKKGG
jgi:hypothetical protein